MSDLPDNTAPTAPDTGLSLPSTSTASWQDQDPVLRDLWMKNQTPQQIADVLGRSVPAIMTRAARLGLPRRSAPGRKPGVRRQDRMMVGGQPGAMTTTARPRLSPAVEAPPQTSLRVCLMCLTKFESAGRHNRICSSCKGSAEYETASSLPELHIPIA